MERDVRDLVEILYRNERFFDDLSFFPFCFIHLFVVFFYLRKRGSNV